ncbi:hypothetical protein B0H19DRAFT_847122, partial [Mycena capillaripes]
WAKDNATSRWEKRLNVRENVENPEGLLVLKSTFNTAWDYFNAKELGDTVINYWRQYLVVAESGRFINTGFPKADAGMGSLEAVAESSCTLLHTTDGLKLLPDVRKTDILSRRMIVSRKRTKNLFDLTNLWKRAVIEKMEEDAFQE